MTRNDLEGERGFVKRYDAICVFPYMAMMVVVVVVVVVDSRPLQYQNGK